MIPRMAKDKVIPVAIVSLLTFITLSTASMAWNKILSSFGQGGVKRTDSINEKVADQKGETVTEVPKNNGGQIPTDIQKTPTINITQRSSVSPTQIKPTNSPIINSNNCIVTIFGSQYDVTTLRSTHSGGDVFTCGTDMTAIYQNHHGSNVSLIAPYLVTTSGSSLIVSPTGISSQQNGQTSGGFSGGRKHDEDDD